MRDKNAVMTLPPLESEKREKMKTRKNSESDHPLELDKLGTLPYVLLSRKEKGLVQFPGRKESAQKSENEQDSFETCVANKL